MKSTLLAVIAALLITAPVAQGAIEAFQFADPQKEERFQRMSEELRCLVCQNQNLADSNADLARDLRTELHRLIQEGASDEEVVQYMVNRYGDFVLYRPPLKTKTYLLWFGPFVLLVIGLVVVVRFVRGSRQQAQEGDLSAQERERLQQILRDSDNKQP